MRNDYRDIWSSVTPVDALNVLLGANGTSDHPLSAMLLNMWTYTFSTTMLTAVMETHLPGYRHRDYFSPNRTTGARAMKHGQWAGLCTARRLRMSVIQVPHPA